MPQSTVKTASEVALSLAFKGICIATYEFTELSDANAFLMIVKAEADKLPSSKVVCHVSVESSSEEADTK